MQFIREIKRGDFFRLNKTGTVYVRGEYDRSSKKYGCYKFDDVNDFRYLNGGTLVYTGFTF